MEVETKALLESLDRVSVVISEKLKSPVRCLFYVDRVYLSARTGNGEAKDICPISGDGQQLRSASTTAISWTRCATPRLTRCICS